TVSERDNSTAVVVRPTDIVGRGTLPLFRCDIEAAPGSETRSLELATADMGRGRRLEATPSPRRIEAHSATLLPVNLSSASQIDCIADSLIRPTEASRKRRSMAAIWKTRATDGRFRPFWESGWINTVPGNRSASS